MIYETRHVNSLEEKAKQTQGQTFSVNDIEQGILQTIPYEYPQTKISVELVSDEFTCICPFSGLPDFARITIRYVPRQKLIELKSLKYYLYAFRNVKIYNEHVVNKILDDLKKVLTPREITIEGVFTSRGGITNRSVVSYRASKKRNN